MINKTQQHPFLRQRTSWFEVFTLYDPETDDNNEITRELQWKEYNRMKLHPEAVIFWGKDPVFDVVVITISGVPRSRLREVATDIYHGKYQRREVNLSDFG